MKTTEQITDELTTLRALEKSLKTRVSASGSNHGDAIEAQIRVLEKRMSEDDAYDYYDCSEENVREDAARAARWLTGDEEDAPSLDWRESPHLFA